MPLAIRHKSGVRIQSSFGHYEYEILDGEAMIATYWHDYRGDEHGIIFLDGRRDDGFPGRTNEFIQGGGPEPIRLSSLAIEYLDQKRTRQNEN